MKAEGYWDRNLMWDAFYVGHIVALFALSYVFVCVDRPLFAILALAFGHTLSGWVAHDYSHAKDYFWKNVGVFVASFGGFDQEWWNIKHDTHHVFPNVIGTDIDIHNEPILQLWFPEGDNDVWFRKYQHLYMYFAYSLLFISWRLQSLIYVFQHIQTRWITLAVSIPQYYFLIFFLGPWISLAGILISGLMSATIVTVTHQSEEIIERDYFQNGGDYDFVSLQYATTEDASTPGFFMHWLWGGMQYQLEHHLFPSLPKYYYPNAAKLAKKFAEENNLSYRVQSVWDLIDQNYQTLKKVALADGPLKRENCWYQKDHTKQKMD